MSEITENRQNLYNNLIDDGYFRGEDGEINFSFEDFCSSLDDKENVETFYANLIDDGYFRDEDGELYLNLDEFIAMVGNTQEKLEYYPITENQRGIYIDWDMNRSSIQYNIIGVETFPDVSADTLAEALRTVVDAHPYLKVHLELKDGDVVQVRRDEDPVVVTVSHLEAKPDKDFFQQRVRPFNVLENDLYRLEVYEYGGETWLFKDMHHLIYDGGSDLFFMQDLNRVLAGDAIEQETYTAYDNALREAKQMLSLQYEEAEAYFDNLINGTNTTVYPHSDIRESDENLSNSISVIIEKSDIEKICLEEGLTGHSFFLAVTEQALHNMTSEKDVQLMTIHNGRTDMRMMGIMGMFVKTVPVVSHLATHGETMIDAAKEVQKQFLKIQSYDFYPYTHIVERHGLSAQIMYDYIESKTVDRPEAEEGLSSSTAKYPLDVVVVEYANCYEVIVGYDMSLYCADDMHLFGDAIRNIAIAAVKNRKAPIATLPVMDDEKVKATLEASSGETIDFEYSETFVKEFKHQVTKTPDNIAVVDASEAISYSELDTKSDALAAVLLSKGVAKDSFVAVVLNRTIEFPLSVLGIHKAGAAYMPIDIAYPSERINYMLTDSESKVVITTRPIAESLKSEKGISFDGQEVLFLDEICLDEHASAIDLSTDDGVAYMIYTSGSTGVPKGAMLHQRGLRNFAASIIRAEELTENDIIASHRSFSFDAHIGDIFPILSVGGQLHIMPSEIRQDLDAIYNYIVDHKITGTGGTTSLMSMLINNYDLPLRFITAGGEKLFGVYSEKMKIINLYGPTECTNDSALYVIEPGQQIENIPIGRPLPNTQSLILSPYGQLLPTGVAGELCITGAQVGYGYWKKPEITQTAFVNNPFGEGKLYHSGDMARYNAEGQIMYVGRIDSQGKLRGYRIDMGEIEANVSAYEGIHQCVASIAEANGNKHLVCFYVVEEGATVDKAKLSEYIEGTTLPKYMYPEMYVELEALPTLPNGKINRNQLPKIEMSADDITMPATESEKVLYDIVTELFKLESIGVNASLLSVGLTSLTAMRMGAMVKKTLNKPLPTKEILKLKTIREIASFLDGSTSSEPDVAEPVRQKRDYYPISENQRGVYIDWEMNRDALQYNLPSVDKIDGFKDAEALRDALVQIVNAHPYLKTRLSMKDGDVVQLRLDDEPVVVEIKKMTDVPTSAFFQTRVRPFDLFNDRLYRMEIYDTPNGLYLFKDIHHLIFDGGSEYVFGNELDKVLSGESLAVEIYTAFDRALDEQELMASDDFAVTESYFDNTIGDAEMIAYPHSDKPDAVSEGSPKNAYVNVEFPCELVDSYSISQGVTSNIFFMTALMQVLHRLTREERIAFTTISNGRADERMFDIMGMFVKTLPVVSVLDAEKDFDSCVKETSVQFIETQSRDYYPFTRLAERYKFRSEIMYVFQGGMVVVDTKKQDNIAVDLDTTKMPLAISVTQNDQNLYNVNFEYDTALYNQNDIQMLADSLIAFANNALKNGSAKVKSIALVNENESQALLKLSQGKTLSYDDTETFVTMVARHGEETPDALAVVDDNGLLTYAELNRQSDALASYLLKQGLKDGAFVGIMLPRVKEFLVAVLAIQKAGGAYVPMDSEYPEDRLQYMLEDSETEILITTEKLYGEKHANGDFTAKHVICIESFDYEANYAGVVNNTQMDGLAYMIYTSGSTGKPKGVMLPHRALRAFLAWRIAEIGITPASRHAQHASFSFDASLDDLLCPLAAGGSVYILPESLRKDMDGIRQYLKSNEITGMTLSTALGMALLGQFNDLPVKFLMMGGEKMLPFQKTPIKVINGYGPTEFSVCSSFHVVDQDKDQDIPIGRPVPNSYSFICDTYGNLLPQGAAGELCLSGKQMAMGYWKREDLTQQKFCETPFGYEVYHTGDLARWNAAGELEFMGRIDNQVKLRGYRIELGEIENQAVLMEGVSAACAQVKEVNGNKHLVLYYTTEGTLDEETLRKHLSASLTEYMVPDTYMLLPEMPLTPNGKVNHRALPVPVVRSAAEYVEPETPKEVLVANLFATLLGVKQPVGAEDSFFSLGGDSIKSIRLVSSLRAEGYSIQVADIMKLKTVRAIAEGLSGGEEIVISQEPWSGVVPDSAIWRFFVDLNLPSPHHFNQSMLVQAAERVDESALRSTVAALVDHHDMLRSIVKDSHLYVRGHEEPNVYGFETVDYTASKNWKELTEDLCAKRQRGFILEQGPLFHVTLFHLPDYDVILLACHHAIVDGVSWRILFEDFNIAYSQAKNGTPISLQPKTHSYKEYAEALHEYAGRYALKQEMDYWDRVQAKLDAMPSSDAKDHTRRMELLNGNLESNTTRLLLSDIGKMYNADINDLLMAAVGRSYNMATGCKDVSVQFEGHGREYVGRDTLLTDRTVGWFTSVYPVILENLNADLRKLIRTTKETMHRIPNKGVGYNILRFLNDDTTYSSDKCALIGFNYLGESSEETDAAFFAAKEVSCGEDFAEDNVFGPDFSINCSVADGELKMSLAYNADVYTEELAKTFLDGIMESLQTIVTHLQENKTVEVTASDLGEQTWSDEEFESVYEHFNKIGTPVQRIYPLSPMQEGIMLKFLIEPDALSYRLVSRMSLDILPTEAQFRYALDRLAAHHEVLRTSIIYRGVEQYRQAIVDRKLGFAMLDYTNKSDIEEAMQKLYLAEQRRGFDMEDEALFRITCVKTSENTCDLLLAVHHIIVDGWCIGLFTQDLVAGLAEAVTGNMQPIVPSTPGRYERYIRDVRKKDAEAGLAYWRKLLEGYTTQAVIPSSGIVPENERSSGEVSIQLDGESVNRLVALATSEQITMNTLVELAWGVVLSAYNRQDDVVFVKVVSGRNSDGESVEDVVGLFINSIPVRVTMKDGMTVRQTLHELQQQAAESNAWDFCPLSEIQQQSELGAQLFQSIFAYENYVSESNGDSNLPFHLNMLYSKEESINDITVTAYSDGSESLVVNIKYDNTKYKSSDIDRVAGVMQHVLNDMGANPDGDIRGITPLDEQMEIELVKLGRGESLQYDTTQTLVDLFRDQVKRTPDSVCVVFQDRKLTYAEVDTLTDRLAIVLQRKYQVKPEMAVGIMIDRSELMVVYPLSIMKAGAAYMPLDFHFPSERLEFMCSDAGVNLILSESTRVQDAMPGYKGKVITSDVLDTLDSVRDSLITTFKPKPENMFVILYTSGSTGIPKGVMLEHRNIVNFCHWYVDEFDVSADDRAVAYANFGFDAHMMDIYPVLSVGGSVYIIPSDMRMDLMAMNSYMEQENLTLAFLTTQVGYMFATTIENHSLRLLSVGGEKLQPLRKPPFRFYNGYGPTECTLYSTFYGIDSDYDSSYIGRPLAGYQLYIVDHNLNLVPRGAAGELIVAGAGVGRGYLNRPDINAEKFITFRGQKAYRTGDLVRWSPDGNIDFMGRIDNQVKLRGLRIEMGEIEARVSSFPGVSGAAVDVKEVCGAQHICCYYTSNEEINIDQLKEFLAEKLADYMIPTAYTHMDSFPLTPNGKVNRRALPIPSVTIQTENVPPANEQEQTLFDIVSELIKTDNFGVTDDLTKLGLTSLLGIKLVMMAAKKNITMKLDDVMKLKTIRGILEHNMNMIFWANGFTSEKPVVVLVCGATPYKDLRPYVEAMSSYYSVLVVEPTSAHYKYIFEDADINEVVEMYFALIEMNVDGTQIAAFTGHCFGGEIAYRLACKWKELYGGNAPMVMLDVFWRVDPLHFDEESLLAMIPDNIIEKYGNYISSYSSAMKMYDNLGRQGEPQLYDGDIVLFRAAQDEPEDPIMTDIYEAAPGFKEMWQKVTEERQMDNRAFWTKYYPAMEVYDMPADHMSMLGRDYVSEYVAWLNKRISTANND